MQPQHCRRPLSWLGVVLFLGAARLSALNEIVVEDIFGRRLNEQGMVLVDWEGAIANPAIKIFVRPPSDATFPASATVSAKQPRLYFDLPSDATANGPTKTLSFPNANPVPVLVSIFPDRDGLDEDHALDVSFRSRDGATRTLTLNLHVTDQDRPERAAEFAITVDFSKDQTGFFADAAKRAVVEQAAQDWSYFFASMNLATVTVGAERTFVWNPDGFLAGSFHTNSSAYRGFLLYVYGVSNLTPPFRSGGEPSNVNTFQSSNGVALPLKRSGGVEVEVKGNYNTLGWSLTTADNDWWQATNLGVTTNELYSIVHHEMGHALIFHPNHTRFGAFKTAGAINDPAVVGYHGSVPAIDATDHLPGAIDRLSGKGGFGYEYYGLMPARRWMITKLDLLVAQAIGYTLRETSAFVPLAITTTTLARATPGEAYVQTLGARGGIPFYRWSIKSGTLPPGLVLNSFTGAITGRATTTGTFSFTAELADYDAQTPPVTAALSIRVTTEPDPPPTIAVQPIAQTVIEGTEAVFSVTASGIEPLAYQWQKDNAVIAGATAATLTLRTVNAAEAGAYRVVVTNIGGSVLSAPALLTVNPAGPAAWLTNLSVRSAMSAGQTLIVGVVVSGGARGILVRAAGPALGGFGLAGAMSDPRVELYNGGVLVVANDDWAPALAPTFTSVGAFAFSAGSKDAALLQSIDGAHSVQVRGTGAGLVLVEAYDTGTGSTPRLINVSARNRVGTGDDILIAGFSVTGTGTKQLLVRAVGPRLAGFGVTSALADPKLEVYSGAARIGENDNWAASLAPTFAAVGAFALEAGSRDAALLTSLSAGSYSVQVRGADGGTGEALVEIYEVP